MLTRFFPKEHFASVFEIDYDRLLENGIRTLIFDIDNTLAPYYVKEPTKNVKELFQMLTSFGFNVCLLSNNNEKRVTEFNKDLNVFSVAKAKKPLLRGITSILAKVNSLPSETCMIGDQAFTDIWCGNRIGVYTILVKPIENKDEFTVKLKRGLERIVLTQYFKNKK